jgi:hypothetical protein
MSTKRRGLGKGVDALFSAKTTEESGGAEFTSSKVEDKSSKLEVRSSQEEGASAQLKGIRSKDEEIRPKEEGNRSELEVVTSGVDALFPAEATERSGGSELISSKRKEKRSEIDVRSSQEEGTSAQLKGKSSKLEHISYNQTAMQVAIRDADKNPRITLWSPVSTAVLKYLRKTTPEFSISEEAGTLLEDAIKKKYPELYEGLKREKEGP